MVRSVERALSVLESYGPNRTKQSLHEIANRIGLSKTTTFRLIETLLAKGYLSRGDDVKYSISFKVLTLAGLVDAKQAIQQAARSPMALLGHSIGEAVAMYAVYGQSRICIEAIEVPSPLMRVVRLGEEVSLLQGAIGRVLLAQLEPDSLNRVLTSVDLSFREKLHVTMDEIRARGYETGHSERVKGATAIAAPVFHRPQSYGPLCVAILGPSVRIDDRIDELAPRMIALARTIRDRINGP
jgi:IclR family KDG regulon transcriptional repressor